MILVAVAVIVAEKSPLSVYLVEEAFTVFLSLSALFILILLTVIAFLLLWQGASLVIRRLKRIVEPASSIRDRRPRAEQAMTRFFPDH